MSHEQNVTPLKRQDDLEFDGERFVPGAGVEITYHHWLRYFFARQFAQGKRVLDVASGEGYGAAYLAKDAQSVEGFDASPQAVTHARAAYGAEGRLTFTRADIEGFFKDAAAGTYDLVTAFEVIEHVDDRLQLVLLEGIQRVLAPGGIALISTPDKQLYSDVKLTTNPFHVREMYRDEYLELLGRVFPHVRVFEQLAYTGSALIEQGATKADLCEMGWTDLLRLKGRVLPGIRGGGEYLVALVSTQPIADPMSGAVMLDRSRKLISEEIYKLQAEAAHLRDVVADLERQNAEIKKVWIDPDRAAAFQTTVDGLLGVIAKNAVEMADVQRTSAELDRVRGELVHVRSVLERERQENLRGMVSVQLLTKAKRAWDRVPLVKKAVKAVVKRVL